MIKINLNDFSVKEGHKVKLNRWPTAIKPLFTSNDHYKKSHQGYLKELRGLQELLYSTSNHALLLIFQGMDAAGKDGAISHVMSGVNPQGCTVHSFKQPSTEERNHDFLWRTTCRLPERGMIGIFNRSYYEEVIVVRVHPETLLSENLPSSSLHARDLWQGRYKSIVDSENHLRRNGTRIIKFFLHLSKKEQRKRLLERIEQPDKNWKFSENDIKERELWNDYVKAYEICLGATSTSAAPWNIIPADDKKNARYIISQVIINTLRSLKMSYPTPSKQRRKELQVIRKLLTR
jgi:PPK2 family polyphosphate:nucleotide phosphotransferase